jgi:hypothetical protein
MGRYNRGLLSGRYNRNFIGIIPGNHGSLVVFISLIYWLDFMFSVRLDYSSLFRISLRYLDFMLYRNCMLTIVVNIVTFKSTMRTSPCLSCDFLDFIVTSSADLALKGGYCPESGFSRFAYHWGSAPFS